MRGHHVFKSIWTPVVGQLLQVQAETGNSHDAYAIAVILDDYVVGHLPRRKRVFPRSLLLSPTWWAY